MIIQPDYNIELHYMPSTAYVYAVTHFRSIISIHPNLHLSRQSFRNRCEIASSQGKQNLIIPILDSRKAVPMADVQIDTRYNWAQTHFQAIKSAYGRSPYWIHYCDGLQELYKDLAKVESLLKINILCLNWAMKLLGLELVLFRSEELNKDLVDYFHPKKDAPSVILAESIIYKPYPQCFIDRYPFIPNLSILDAIMNLGKNWTRCIEIQTV